MSCVFLFLFNERLLVEVSWKQLLSEAIACGFCLVEAKPPCYKSPAEREVMERALKNNNNLQGLAARL